MVVSLDFTGGAGVQSKYGFGRGFDTYVDDRYFGGFDYSIPLAISWMREHRHQQKPFFAFVHVDMMCMDNMNFPKVLYILFVPNTKSKLQGDIEENAKI